MNEELKKIKKLYGEEMAHLCRELFPTILEKEGLLLELLIKRFNPSRFLYEDIIKQNQIEEFKNFIYSLVDVEKKEVITEKNPFELLSEADYDLYECKTESDIQSFKKHYAAGEELCTFRGNRLESCHVFFAVKKDVDDIKREDYKNPQRQDLYGTSVISIQFSRGDINSLSIKNRYNHTVNNPDATFGNNLENIIPGLTTSFEKEYLLNIKYNEDEFQLNGYVKANDGKFYKFNIEENNIYYCSDNIIIDNFKVKRYDPSRYLIIDNFILDLKNKKIELYDRNLFDGFIESLEDMDKISVTNTKYGKELKITFQDNTKESVIIKIDKTNSIIGLNNPNLEEAETNFLYHNKNLSELNLPNLKIARDCFLRRNYLLKELNLPKLIKIESDFLAANQVLTELNLPLLTIVQDTFLLYNHTLLELTLPSLTSVGNYFLSGNRVLIELNLPSLVMVGNGFMHRNHKLTELNSPLLTSVGNEFLKLNNSLTELSLPSLLTVGDEFLNFNDSLMKLSLPSLTSVGNQFLSLNTSLPEIDLPMVTTVNSYFLRANENITKVNMPMLKNIGNFFLYRNKQRKTIMTSLGLINEETVMKII